MNKKWKGGKVERWKSGKVERWNNQPRNGSVVTPLHRSTTAFTGQRLQNTDYRLPATDIIDNILYLSASTKVLFVNGIIYCSFGRLLNAQTN
jgi:hypothetical protein